MSAHVARVGKLRCIHLPDSLLELAGIGEDAELRAEPGRILIEAATRPRAGWMEAARTMAARGDDVLLARPTSTRFDANDWKW